MNHIQCNLIRGNQHYTCWLPEKFAKINKIVKIEEEDGWRVVSVGMKLPSSVVNERSQDYKKTRKASDI